MNAPITGGRFRLVEDPLGPDALDRPTPEEVRALWEAVRRQPIPSYNSLRRLVIRGGA